MTTENTFALRPDGQILVTGSLAFDQIMVFPGNFKDHILPEKLHIINISFLVSEMRKQRGGCAGNIAYTLALLGSEPRIVAAGGSDFADYASWLEEKGVDTSAIAIFDQEITASCFITTDRSDNQITGFFPGAMKFAKEISLKSSVGARASICIIAPDDPDAMMRHTQEAREADLPFLFDPSFQVTAMGGADLAQAAKGAAILTVNDYEFAVFEKKIGGQGTEVFDLVEMAIVTLGSEGSKILRRAEPEIRIPAAGIERFVDPTGAGDAYRAGFLAGLTRGMDLGVCGRMGSVAAAFVVEQNGTQSHVFAPQEFIERYRADFGSILDLG